MFAWICLMVCFSAGIFYGVTRHVRHELATKRYASKESLRFDFVGMVLMFHIVAAFVSAGIATAPGLVIGIICVVALLVGGVYGLWILAERVLDKDTNEG